MTQGECTLHTLSTQQQTLQSKISSVVQGWKCSCVSVNCSMLTVLEPLPWLKFPKERTGAQNAQ